MKNGRHELGPDVGAQRMMLVTGSLKGTWGLRDLVSVSEKTTPVNRQ